MGYPGINLSVYFSTSIFAQVGLSPFMSQLLAALMNTAFALGSVPLIWTIERFGRRPILLWSAVALTICLAVFVAMIGQPNPNQTTQWIAVAAIFVYNIIFGYGWIGVCWLYGPEVRSTRLVCHFRQMLTNMGRLPPSSFATRVPQPEPLASGCSPSLLSLLEERRLTE